MVVKNNWATGQVLTASDVNTYLTNGGLVYITQTLVSSGTATTLSINNCFTSSYDNYRIVIDGFTPQNAGRGLNFRLRVGGVDASGAADYWNAFLGLTAGGAASNFSTSGDSYGSTGIYNSSITVAFGATSIDIFNPAKAERTFANVHGQLYDSQLIHRTGSFAHTLTTAYDGFTLFLSGTGNIVSVRVRVYGYRQA